MEVQRRSKERRDTGTRARLLAAAGNCLRTEGIQGASSRAIAGRAGANLAAITYHFGSKEQLVHEALADELRRWTEPAMAALDGPGDPATRLFDAVGALNTAFDTARDGVPALLEAFVHSARNAAVEAAMAEVWCELRARITRVIQELREAGVVPAWIDPEAMAALILAVGAGTIVAVTVDATGTDHHAIGAQFAALLLAARVSGD